MSTDRLQSALEPSSLEHSGRDNSPIAQRTYLTLSEAIAAAQPVSPATPDFDLELFKQRDSQDFDFYSEDHFDYLEEEEEDSDDFGYTEENEDGASDYFVREQGEALRDVIVLCGIYTLGIGAFSAANFITSIFTMNAMVYKYVSYSSLVSSSLPPRWTTLLVTSFWLGLLRRTILYPHAASVIPRFNRRFVNPPIPAGTWSYMLLNIACHALPFLYTYPVDEYIYVSCLGIKPPSVAALYTWEFFSRNLFGRITDALLIEEFTELISVCLKYLGNTYNVYAQTTRTDFIRASFQKVTTTVAISQLSVLHLYFSRRLYRIIRNAYSSPETSSRLFGCTVSVLLMSIAVNQASIHLVSASCHFLDDLYFRLKGRKHFSQSRDHIV